MNTDYVPLLLFLVCCCVIVVPFTALVVFLILRGRKQAWTGVVIDKKTGESVDYDSGNTSTNYSLRIKKDTGKEFNLGVDSGRYEKFKIGDKLKKESGKFWPEKI